MNNLPGGNFSAFFVRNNHNYSFRSRSELTVPSIKTVFKGNAQFIFLCNPQKCKNYIEIIQKLCKNYAKIT